MSDRDRLLDDDENYRKGYQDGYADAYGEVSSLKDKLVATRDLAIYCVLALKEVERHLYGSRPHDPKRPIYAIVVDAIAKAENDGPLPRRELGE